MTQRLSRQGLARLRQQLSDRDLAVVQSLGQHRFLTARQIEALHFQDHATTLSGTRICRRTLARLNDERVLARLQRRTVGGLHAGSASYIYSLGPVGIRLLDDRDRRVVEPSITFLDHTLAVADVHVRLVQQHRAGRLELLEVQAEPDCWRAIPGVGGNLATLRPDLSAVTGNGDYEDCWFIEVDRGTASIPAIGRKCQQYVSYRNSGAEQTATGTFPIILWITTDEQRRDRIARVLSEDGHLGPELFRVATGGDYVQVFEGGMS
jgi:Replication-relaxation